MVATPNRIRELRDALGLTQKEVGARVGLSSAQISRLEKGERPLSVPWMNRLARVLGCTPAELLAEQSSEEPPRTDPASAPVARTRQPGFRLVPPGNAYSRPWPVPLWDEGASFCPHGCVYFGEEFLKRLDLDPMRCVVIEVHDSSMSPTFPSGSVCLVDCRYAELVDGVCFAFEQNGDPVIRWARNNGTDWLLIADDYSAPYYPWGERTRCIGRVIWTARLINHETHPKLTNAA